MGTFQTHGIVYGVSVDDTSSLYHGNPLQVFIISTWEAEYWYDKRLGDLSLP